MTTAWSSINRSRLSPHRSRHRRRSHRPVTVGRVRFWLRFELMEDRTLLSTFTVINTGDTGPGSLRQAILDSNADTAGENTIGFAIPGQGVQTIAPLSALPPITQAVLIDSFSQPGYAGTPLIEIAGNQAGATDGLVITGSGVTVRGLDINNFFQGAGIHITGSGATGDWIYGDFLGTDPTGTQAEPNAYGVEIDGGATDNLVGTNGDGVGDATERNLISGNLFAGVWITGQGTSGNAAAGNWIGTDITGAVALNNGTQAVGDSQGNVFGGGVAISGGASGNRIGTDGNSVDDVGQQNVIAGSNNDAIDIYGAGTDGNIVAGNFIGTDATGNRSLGIAGDGVFLAEGASYNWIGVNPSGGTAVADEGNVISGNGNDGFQITAGANNNVLAGNKIGTDVTGTVPLGNAMSGIQIYDGASSNTIGGVTADAGNLIANNGGPGVGVTDICVGDQITANRIFGNRGQAIDLGNDGVTYNSTSPRQGPNNLQNFPIIVTTADGSLQGWLGGSTPDTPFHLEFFASAAYGPGGSGEAQDYLGSLEVTTDATGQVTFAVPFTAPPDKPVITATATDPQGNTSEVSAQRRASLEAPSASVRAVPNQRLLFSAAMGDGIAVQDPDAGPLNPAWDLTLSVAAGALTLSRLEGLVGSGSGTSTLQYQGSLSALNAALEGMTFTATTGFHGNFTMSLDAEPAGGRPLQAQVNITDGFFSVTTTADSGPGSLRQAILDSDAATGGSNTIAFAILGQGAQAIAPLSPLPAITNPVLIDGFSQRGYAGAPLIELSGSQAGAANGLTIAGSGVTVRGLDINSFAEGAGILISGTSATGNSIEANDIGTDSAGTRALPNHFGIQILSGADDNLVGGVTAADGNLIAFNAGPGVDVEGDTTVGNQITANRIFANDATPTPTPAGALQFDGSSDVGLPNDLIRGFEQTETIEAWFQTKSGGVILGYQGSPTDSQGQPAGWVPALYVGTDGRLYGDIWQLNQVVSNVAVNDGRWHSVALVVDGSSSDQQLYLDGQLVSTGYGSISDFGGSFNQIGTGYTDGWPATPGGWYGFVGQIDDVRIWSEARSAGEISQDMTTALSGTESGLQAYYPFDEGQGLTAQDVTSNHNDGTLAGSSGDLPTWVVPGGEAIDLGDDGITYNATSPRQGPNNFQNFPIIATTAGGSLQGWLGGSTPDTTFRIDVFAGAGYSPGGAGQAQDYLGSLEATTDSQGQAVFDVPFSPPAGLPAVTAAATDPLGNTSEVSALRRATLQAPTQSVREVPGLPLLFAAASGDGIVLQDPDAGPLDPPWNLTLSVAGGMLTLRSTAGLTGSGDGTGSLSYSGPISVLDKAMEGLTFTPLPNFHGETTLNLNAESDGARLIQARVPIVDPVFVVDTTADTGPGSLRQAVLDSNAQTGGTNRIDFAIPGTGVQTIALGSPLPPITASVLIDGTTQPGFAGTPLIALPSQPPGNSGTLVISAAEVTIRGLAIDQVAIDAVTSDFLIGYVHAQNLTTHLSLLDSQGQLLIRSDGLAPGNADDAIDQHLVAGTYTLQVESTGGNGSFTLTTTLTPASAPFQPIPVGSGPDAIVAGDFNGDGKLDLAVANNASNDVSVLLGNGDGTFQPQVTYAVGLYPVAITAGDFTGDGHLDLAIANSNNGSGTVSVLLGNGDGTFQPQVTYVVGQNPTCIVAGDFTGDGRTDLAVANSNYVGPGTVSVLLGNGDGTFLPQVAYAVGLEPHSIVAGDFNGDGRLDLAVADAGNELSGGPDPGGVSVLLANGDGTFQAAVQYAAGSNPDAISTGDFTGNGHLDLAVANLNSNDVSVLLGNGDGTFQPQVTLAVGTGPDAMVAGDFTGSGHLDLAVANSDDNTVSVLLGNGDGTFQSQVTTTVGPNTHSIVAGDFNGDGRLDVAGASPGSSTDVFVFLGTGDGTFQSQVTNAAGSGPQAIVAGDFNGDGRLDLAVANNNNDISVLLGNNDGTFNPPIQYAAGVYPDSIVAGDFNGDGRLDLAVAGSNYDSATNTNINEVSVLLGNGDGTFQPAVQYAVGNYPGSIVAGDFNGDGRIDLAVAGDSYNSITNTNVGEVSVLLGNGDGTFQPPVTYAVGSVPTGLVAGDFNGDGHLDLAVANELSGTVSVLLGNGDGTFGPQVTYAVAWFSTAIMAGDINGDGRLDLAVANLDSNVISVLQGNGDGTFGPQVTYTYAVGGLSSAIVAGDFNGDGRLDLAVGTLYGNTVSVLLGNGDGTFRPQATYAVGQYPRSIVAGDFTGDGRTDLATTNYQDNTVSVLLGNGDGTFSDPSQLATTPHATPLVADVNGDGTEDVLVINGAGDILYRQGQPGRPGSFDPPVTINPGNPSRDIAWVPNTSQGPVLASVDAKDNAISFYAYRDGRFVRLSGSLTTGQLPAQVIAADLSGDGLTDLVVRNAGVGTLSVYFGGQNSKLLGPLIPPQAPAFLPPVTLPVGLGVSDVQAIDTTGTGRLDLVVTNKLSGQVSILHNLGNGIIAPPEPYRAGTGLSAIDTSSGSPEVTSLEATAGVAAGSFTPGSPTDLVTANPGSNTLGMLAGLGNGRFANPVALDTSNPARVLRVADFNHDGIPDLAVLTAKGVSIYLGDGSGGFSKPVTYDAGPDPTGLTVADLNHDGSPDLLVGNSYGDVLLLVNQGNGTFEPYHKTDQAITLAVADLAGNGSKDVIYADQGLDRVVVDYGAGGSAVLGDQATGLLSPGAVKLADLSGDGIPDLIVANSGSNNVLIYPGLGNGQFGPAVNGGHGYFVGTNPVGITVANLTGALPDLVVADKGSNQVSILLNQGDFRFNPGPRLNSGGTGPVSTVVGHFTGGPYPDILVTNSGSNDVKLLPGVGQGFFNDTNPRTFAVGANPVTSFVGSFDGKPDLVTVNAGSNDLTLISGFMSADAITSTISSGGTDPLAAFSFNLASGFDNLVVGNSGDGVLALFEGSAEGLTLSSSETMPGLPSPTALVFAGVAGSQVEFYGASEGREAAVLVALSLGGEIGPLSSSTSSATPTVAQLVPLQESSLALVGSLLIVTLPSSASELNLGPTETEAATAQSLSSVAPVGSGQSVLTQSRADGTGSANGEPAKPEGPEASADLPAAPPWQPLVLGTDEALERFDREHPVLSPAGREEAHETSPSGGQGQKTAPVPANMLLRQGQSESGDPRLEAIDQSIEFLGGHAPVVLQRCINHRVGETHRKFNCMRNGLMGFTHATIRSEPGQEERFGISAALALAATVAHEFYFRSVDGRARGRLRLVTACGRLGLRGND